jgi:ABC-type dipeptide/oligopeptide/nickel transport system ATPase component
MTIVFGESSSGKSTTALELIDYKDNCLYFSFDGDKQIESKAKNYKNIDLIYIKSFPRQLDINIEIIHKNRKSKLTHIIIDPINYLLYSLQNTEDFSSAGEVIKKVMDEFLYIENSYRIEPILVFNTLKKVETPLDKIFSNFPGIKMIKTSD